MKFKKRFLKNINLKNKDEEDEREKIKLN